MLLSKPPGYRNHDNELSRFDASHPLNGYLHIGYEDAVPANKSGMRHDDGLYMLMKRVMNGGMKVANMKGYLRAENCFNNVEYSFMFTEHIPSKKRINRKKLERNQYSRPVYFSGELDIAGKDRTGRWFVIEVKEKGARKHAKRQLGRFRFFLSNPNYIIPDGNKNRIVLPQLMDMMENDGFNPWELRLLYYSIANNKFTDVTNEVPKFESEWVNYRDDIPPPIKKMIRSDAVSFLTGKHI